MAAHLCRWIPEWALRYGEWDQLSSATMVEMVRRAALKVYATESYESRGEFGELMLHAVIRWEFDTEPAISKIYFKDHANDTVKGFDCVHISKAEDGKLDLWLGEAKFYARRSEAISAIATELQEHLGRDYLREEFALVLDKLDPSFPWAGEVRSLLDEQNPLDEIVSRLRVPVLLAYDSNIVREHSEVCEEYESALKAEAEAVRKALLQKIELKPLPRDVVIELILLPVDDKKQLTKLLDQELRNWQGRA